MQKDINGWISVTDALPEFEEDVLLWYLFKEKQYITIGYLERVETTKDGSKPSFWLPENDRLYQEIHFWQKLPKGPINI